MSMGLSLAGCQLEGMIATPNLLIQRQSNYFAGIPSSRQTPQIKLIYATDRKASIDASGNTSYSFQRSEGTEFGTCTITLGEGIQWQKLCRLSLLRNRPERVSVKMTRITPVGKIQSHTMSTPKLIDGRITETDEYIEQLNESFKKFGDLLREQLAVAQRKELFIFVHGYNNTFESGATRMGQLWHYLGHIGVPMIYSWPAGSPGLLTGYTHDRESSEFTIFHFRQILKAAAATPELEKIHIIGHSRGTDVVMHTLRDMRLQVPGTRIADFRKFKIGHVVLAAPDVDTGIAVQKFGADRVGYLVPQFLTLYINPQDFALAISNILFAGKNRIGNFDDQSITDHQTNVLKHALNFSAIRLNSRAGSSSHDYFVSNPAVLSDLILLLKENRRPGKANGRPLKKLPNGLWQISDDYPKSNLP